MKAVSLKVFHFSKWVLLAFLILIALFSGAGWTLLNNVEHFKASIEQELTDYGIKGVAFENIEGHWDGLQPLLKIRGASLSIPGRSQALSMRELSLRVKLVPSLLSGNLILESFHTNIEKLVLVRDDEGIWWLNDIPLSSTNSDEANLDIYTFFQRLPTFVNIDVGLVQLRDPSRGVDYVIQHSTLRSSRKKQQLSLEFLTHLPSTLGQNFKFVLTGDERNQQLYIKADKLNLAQLSQLVMVSQTPLHKAIISLQSWVDLEQFHIKKAITSAKISNLSFDSEQKTDDRLVFSVQQKVDADDARWLVNTNFKQITKGKKGFDDVKTLLKISKKGEKPKLWIEQLELSFLNHIFQGAITNPSTQKIVAHLQPEATIENILAELDINDPMQSKMSLNFSNYSSQGYQAIPAINSIDGSVVLAQGVTRLRLKSDNASLKFGDLFRESIKLDTLEAQVHLLVKDSTLIVNADHLSVSNADISLQARLQLDVPTQGGRPFLSLRANYVNGQVAAVSKYLPVKIMHESVVKWLDKSLQGGQIPQGDFLFHGRLNQPTVFTQQHSGIMHAAFTIKNPTVDYLDKWPVASQGDGTIEFLNTSMNAHFSNITYADVSADKVELDIADFLAANLRIKVNTKTNAKKLLNTMSRLPILNIFDEVKHKTKKISGSVSAELNIDVPLSVKLKKKLNVTAQADLKDVALSIPDWMIDFKTLKGQINIDNEKVSATGLSAKFYGDNVRLGIRPDSRRQRTHFHLTGNLHSRHLLTLTPEYLQNPVSGISPWKVSVSVGHEPSKKSAILEITAKSSLSGTQLSFPQPSKVASDETRAVSFNARLLDQGDFPFTLSLADTLKVEGQLNLTTDSEENLHWLNVSLGDVKKISERSGVTVAGNTDLIDLNDWFSFQKQYFSTEDKDSPPFLQQINFIELEIGRMILADQQTLNSEVVVNNDGKTLQGTINSSMAKGKFELPYRLGVLAPFKAEMEFMTLKKSESEGDINIDIADMPNVYIQSKQVSYEKMIFSDLTLSTRNELNNFVIEQFDFSRDKVHLKSSGSWQFKPNTKDHVSVFNIDIKGSNFGKAVSNLGLGKTIKGSKVKFNGQIGWGGELYNINWPTLIGEVELKLKDGYLNNVDPGAGRFVGLLSFNALPRRLFLDFGDVVKEGMQFNTIKGKFVIKGEILETNNASMDSVSAKVKVKGTTNLRHQTYDQTMIIIPKVGDTLPLLGTLVAGNAVGWGLLLLQKIFKKPIDKSVEIEYKVSGTWEKPDVNQVKKAKPAVKEENDYFYDIDA